MEKQRTLSKLAKTLAILAVISQLCVTCASAAAQERILYRFTGGADGAQPISGLIFDAAGNLYGITVEGGTGNCEINNIVGCGTVFELSPGKSWTESVIHNFTGGKDGQWPGGVLTSDSAGNLYGTTTWGGGGTCNYGYPGCGIIFELIPAAKGWTETILYQFQGNDGALPYGGLTLDSQGDLYGTTFTGGASSSGIVFELKRSPAGKWTESLLHTFAGNPAENPEEHDPLLFDSQGNLYGTTWASSSKDNSYGTVFKLSPDGDGRWHLLPIHLFKFGVGRREDGQNPTAGVISDAMGDLYGTAAFGGQWGRGMVYELVPGGGRWQEKRIFNFGHNFNDSDGDNPYAPLIMDSAGNLYGTTTFGGRYGYGLVFKLTPTGHTEWNEIVLHDFRGGSDGANPFGGLVSDAVGNLYGTTYAGGNNGCDDGTYIGCGVVFEITP